MIRTITATLLALTALLIGGASAQAANHLPEPHSLPTCEGQHTNCVWDNRHSPGADPDARSYYRDRNGWHHWVSHEVAHRLTKWEPCQAGMLFGPEPCVFDNKHNSITPNLGRSWKVGYNGEVRWIGHKRAHRLLGLHLL